MLILQTAQLGHSTEAACLRSPRLWRWLDVATRDQKPRAVLFTERREGAGVWGEGAAPCWLWGTRDSFGGLHLLDGFVLWRAIRMWGWDIAQC